jgi:transposase
LQKKLISVERENNFLKEKLELVDRQMFGRRSEKRPELSPQQLNVFSGQAEAEKRRAQKISVAGHTREVVPKDEKESDGVRFPEHLPRKDVPLDVPHSPAAEKISERITERLALGDAQFKVIRYIRPAYKEPNGKPVCAPAAAAVLERCAVEPSFLAYMAVAKFMWHLPLNRQAQMLKALGIKLSADTLIRYTLAMATLLEPLWQELKAAVLKDPRVSADETPVLVGKDRDGRKEFSKAYFWPVLSKAGVVFHYTATRATREIKEMLGGFRGYVQCDGYQAYETLAAACPGIVLMACWAHARRKYIEAEKGDPARVKKALKYIRLLYRVEGWAKRKTFPADQLLRLRARWSVRILKSFKAWLSKLMAEPDVLPKSFLCAACSYALSRWEALNIYTTDSRLSIDSNEIEREIRPVAIGRKNHLFCASEVGARAAAILYSLIASCKMAGADPQKYLEDVIVRIGTNPHSQLNELLPQNWKTAFGTAKPEAKALPAAA